MQKAAQKQEYRWEDFRTESPLLVEYEKVKDFDTRFFYYDSYVMISESLLHSTDRSKEETKCMEWAIEEEDLEPGLALDPNSFAAKALQRKRKEPPTEEAILASVRKRPATPPTGGGEADSSQASTAESHRGPTTEAVFDTGDTLNTPAVTSVTTTAPAPGDSSQAKGATVAESVVGVPPNSTSQARDCIVEQCSGSTDSYVCRHFAG